jgi:hypothetical protein
MKNSGVFLNLRHTVFLKNRKKMPRQCVFCKRIPPEINITNEHVLPGWLRQHLGLNDSKLRMRQNYLDPETGEKKSSHRISPTSPFEMKVKKVCGKCNNEWLSQIEGSIKPFILDLANGHSIKLNETQKQRLALWAAKTAMTRSLMDKGARHIPDEHYQFLMQQQSPPPNTTVWLGYCHAPYDTWNRHLRFTIFHGEPSEILCHCTTIVLCSVMVMVIGFSSEHPAITPEAITNMMKFIIEDSIQKIWPPSPDDLIWPLNTKLTSDEVIYISELAPKILGIAEPNSIGFMMP